MRYLILICVVFVISGNIVGQEVTQADEGSVSYVTSQNVYVKFESTKNIEVGDTLFNNKNGHKVPALVVTNISSISCVCVPVSGAKFAVGDKIVGKAKTLKDTAEKKVAPVVVGASVATSEVKPDVKEDVKISYPLTGRLSVASYSNFSNTTGGNSQRMRYTFALNAKKIGGSKISADTYISFVHKDDNWSEISSNIFYGLKIYSLNVMYEPTETMKIILGRKINPKISNIGAVDGLQFEKKFNSFTLGAFAGSRPNYTDYSFDLTLPQFGAYLGHTLVGKHGNGESTLAFVEQTNDWKTDRRFAYFQHSNTMLNKLYFFGSAELELYQKIDGVEKSTFNLNNLYLMLRYKVIRQLSLSISYRSQNNMIYYETYKSYVDQLLEQATVQGFRFQVNYRPVNKVSIGVRASYRASKKDLRPTKSLYGYVAFSNVPGINVSATLSTTFLETSYLSGKIYSVGLSRDIIRGKLLGSVSYRYVDYNFVNYDAALAQNIGGVNLTWRIMRKLSFTATYEGIFESVNNYTRLYVSLTKRF